MSKKYIPDNSCLTCDKGSSPVKLKVTHHNNTKIYGEYLASEMDMIPGENIQPMGRCSATGGSCKFEPIYWDKTNKGVKVNGYKLLFEDANLLCKKGGKIKVDFNVPGGSAAVGGGYGIDKGSRFLGDRFGESADLLKKTAKENFTGKTLDEIAKSSNEPKRVYGEEKVKLDLKAKGYDIISTDMGKGQNGLDIAATDPNGTTDIVSDGKFKTRGGKPTMDGTKKSGRQLSDKWLNDGQAKGNSRVQKALPPEDAQRIGDKVDSGDPTLKRVAGKVEPNGKLTYHEVDNTGKVGAVTEIPPANVMRGTSKAANAVNDISRSIQGTKAISAANSFIVENAGTISRVGKVVGRGAIVVGIVLDGLSIYSAYEEEGGFGKKTKAATGSAVGGLAGGIAGAELGATIGAIGGPVGVVVGGIVGGIIGGVIGSGLGSTIAGWF